MTAAFVSLSNTAIFFLLSELKPKRQSSEETAWWVCAEGQASIAPHIEGSEWRASCWTAAQIHQMLHDTFRIQTLSCTVIPCWSSFITRCVPQPCRRYALPPWRLQLTYPHFVPQLPLTIWSTFSLLLFSNITNRIRAILYPDVNKWKGICPGLITTKSNGGHLESTRRRTLWQAGAYLRHLFPPLVLTQPSSVHCIISFPLPHSPSATSITLSPLLFASASSDTIICLFIISSLQCLFH